jgi:GNAT superfamily N-acetyltransferase
MQFQFDILANNPKFIPIVANWLLTEWEDIYKDIYGITTTDGIVSFINKNYINTETIPIAFVGYDDKKEVPICFACIDTTDMNIYPTLTPWFCKLFVLPEYRNKGIATQMITFVMNYLSSIIIDKPDHIFASTDSSDIVQFLSKYGFFVIGTHSRHSKYKYLHILEKRLV